jgi:hypothetical protein
MAVPKGVSHYGAPITLDQAKKVMAAAEAKAIQNNWYVAISNRGQRRQPGDVASP